MCVILAARRAQLEELAPRLACGCNNDGIPCCIQNACDCLLAAQGIVVCIRALWIRESTVPHEERALSAALTV